MIEDKDLRAAVQRGLITEAQAAGLAALADARMQARERVEPGKNPLSCSKALTRFSS